MLESGQPSGQPTGISEMGVHFIMSLRDAIIMGCLWDSSGPFGSTISLSKPQTKNTILRINGIFRPNFQMFLFWFLCMLKDTEVILWLEMYIKDKNRLLISKNKIDTNLY